MQQTQDMDGPSSQARTNPSEPIALVREGVRAPSQLIDPVGDEATDLAETQSESQWPVSAVPSWVPTGFAVLGFVVLFYTVIRSLRRNAARRKRTPDSLPSERIEKIRSDASTRNMIEGYSCDAIELTQRLAAQLDNKAERLEQLVARAERAIAELAGNGPTGPRLVRQDDDPLPNTVPPLHRRIYALADEGLDVLSIAQQLEQPQGQVELVLALRRA